MGPRGVAEGLGMHWDSNYSKTGPGYKDKAKWGRVGPVRAEWGLVGPSRAEFRAEWGWGGVGHALGFKLL